MATMERTTCVWSGFVGSPGYTNFFTLSGVDITAKIGDFFSGFTDALPNVVTITVPSTGDTFDETTGELNGVFDRAVAPRVIVGTGGAEHAGPVGAVVNWKTNTLNRAHKVRGRTFIVPLTRVAYAPDGSLDGGVLAMITASAQSLVADLNGGLVVWSRPINKLGGRACPVVSANVPDLAAVLRSRRD